MGRKIQSAYGVGAATIPVFPVPVSAQRAPVSGVDVAYPQGQSWFDNSQNPAVEYVFDGRGTWATGTPGTLSSLTGNTGTALPVAGNIQIAGTNTITTTGSGSTITVTATSAGYPVTPYVVGPSGKAGYQTVQTAVNAANAAGGGTVYIQEGSYTENLTLYSGVSLYGNDFANVTITGLHTPPTSGNLSFQNLTLASATHIFSSAAAGTASLSIANCILTVTNGYVFNLANWTGSLSINDSSSNGTNDGVINNTAGAPVSISICLVGAGTGHTLTYAGGSLLIEGADIACPVSIGASASLDARSGAQFLNTLTTTSSASAVVVGCYFFTGANAAISHGSSGTFSLSQTTVDSSHSPAIAGSGAGIMTITDAAFISNTAVSGSLTLAAIQIRGGNFVSQYVVGPAPDAQFQTVQSAVNAAHTAGGGTVYVQDGSYSESLTLYDGISIYGNDFGNVSITGVHTPPASGTISFENITLASATHILSSAVAGTTDIVINDCILTVTNGYIFNLLNWTGPLSINNSASNGTNDGVVNNTGGSAVSIAISLVGAGSSNVLTYAGGTMVIEGADVVCPISIGAGATLDAHLGTEFNSTLTTTSNAIAVIAGCYFFTGSSAAISHGSSGAFNLAGTVITSSNNPAIAGSGAGTLTITGVDFTSNSAISGSLTLAYGASTTGTVNANGNLIFGKAGNKIVSSSVATTTTAGANSFGSVTLASGTATVATTAVTASSLIFIWRQSPGLTGAAALGELSVGTITGSTSFVINALTTANSTVVLTTDASVVGWMIVN